MSFIQFESATEKERIRQELRNAREELLNKAKKNAEDRAKFETERKLRGDDQWMLPSLAEKIEKQSTTVKEELKSKKKLKEKKSKKEKKKKRKHKRSQSPSKDRKHKKKSKRRDSSESDSSSEDPGSGCKDEDEDEDEWIEKKTDSPKSEENLKRDDWMTSSFLLPTFSKNVQAKEKDKQHIDSYDPGKSSRELNPYWKDGGTGLPAFRKPKDEDVDDIKKSSHSSSYKRQPTGNWRKKTEAPRKEHEHSSRSRYRRSREKSSSESPPDKSPERNKKTPQVLDDEPTGTNTGHFLTDQQMNELGAKLIKAEIMGNEDCAKELKERLEKARQVRQQIKDTSRTVAPATRPAKGEDEHILLTTTDSRGATRPLAGRSSKPTDPYSKKRDKRKKAETHEDGKRIKYFPDDDRYDIKQMFEREKYATASESDAQFAEIAGKNKSKDDLDDIFADKVRKEISEQDRDEQERKRAIWEHQRLEKTLETCERCFDSPKMEKQLLVSMGSTSYLALPWHEALQPGHCTIAPIQHVSCATQLDEDTWAEVNDFRKSLVRMFAERGEEVIFFEIARYLNRRPHMVIHCIPSKNFEMAPFYFKKAIQESEHMWSTNKQLISLRDRDLRRAIPKGLPYFWVHFGMESGFAHVIEDQERFPANFAQEIIGGMLELDQRAWRKPRKEQNSIQKVKQFADMWKPFDCTN